MYGALAGDICGSIYEWNNRKTETPEKINLIDDECQFTDDSVLTIGVADALLSGGDYKAGIVTWARKYPHSGYGGSFRKWFKEENPQPYNSWGNGSAMRVSPVGWAFGTLEETLDAAKKSAEVTHNHPEGIKGAQATAAAIFLARNGKSKAEIKEYVEKEFAYNLDEDLGELRKTYTFDESCQGTVPPAIMAFLVSNDFVHAIQIAISLGGDTDTLACITGSIAEAFYKEIPAKLAGFINAKISGDMKQVIKRFHEKYLQVFGLDYYIK
ncbi:MAG: ADP-ribosylglycohydrolase family protein [Spirochaetaceae bacterium]|jgi:ADP-ribosylglycohydrolase|nr:ADP-ribosylglycohydrolase family protein [Spirochaetaceae bacterium]